jgi:hypothetical protein
VGAALESLYLDVLAGRTARPPAALPNLDEAHPRLGEAAGDAAAIAGSATEHLPL